jgi:Ca-activated chloride channel family protein
MNSVRKLLISSLWAICVPASADPFLSAQYDGQAVALPLLEMQVEVTVSGVMLQAVVTQRFENASPVPVDAVYRFPLPDRAAVHDMTLKLGERTIVAEIREREQARQQFEQAKQEGQRASLVESDRPNLFSTSVANIAAGETIEVTIVYLEELRSVQGSWGLVIPLGITPRFGETEPVVSNTLGRARLNVQIDVGLPLEQIESNSHPIRTGQHGARVGVTTVEELVSLDRDFQLSWRVQRAAEPMVSMLLEDRADGRYGLLWVEPPQRDASAAIGLPTETMLVIDVSGSMAGPSLDQAKQAVIDALGRLRPGDRFNLVKFSDQATAYQTQSVAVGQAEVEAAQHWVQSLGVEGGTEIGRALELGLSLLRDARSSLTQRLVLITDGAVANETELLTQVSAARADVRLHMIGIGDAPNRWLMRQLAEVGRGFCWFINGHEPVGPALDEFLARIERPVLSNIQIRWEGAVPLELFPRQIPDLYQGEPLLLTARFAPEAELTAVTIDGEEQHRSAALRLMVKEQPLESQPGGLAVRWARAKVEAIQDGLHTGADPEAVRREVIAVALEHKLVTPYTSLIAVDTELAPVDRTAMLPAGGTAQPLISLIGALLACLGAAGLWLSVRRDGWSVV